MHSVSCSIGEKAEKLSPHHFHYMVETGKGPLRKTVNYKLSNRISGHQLSSCLIPDLRGGYTEIVPGFHRDIAASWEEVLKRTVAGSNKRLKRSRHVKNLSNFYLPEDAKRFGEFEKVICRRGWARITWPEILHGSTVTVEDCKGVRRKVLPWFVGVDVDNNSSDCPDSNTWDQLAISHLEQTAPGRTPSGPCAYSSPAPTKTCPLYTSCL